jgi:hypothetical protein
MASPTPSETDAYFDTAGAAPNDFHAQHRH